MSFAHSRGTPNVKYRCSIERMPSLSLLRKFFQDLRRGLLNQRRQNVLAVLLRFRLPCLRETWRGNTRCIQFVLKAQFIARLDAGRGSADRGCDRVCRFVADYACARAAARD